MYKVKKLITKLSYLLLTLFILLSPQAAFAVSPPASLDKATFNQYAENNILFYWPNGCSNGSAVTIIGDSISNMTRAEVKASNRLPDADIHAQDGKTWGTTVGDNVGGLQIAQELVDNNTMGDILVFALGTNNRGSTNNIPYLTADDITALHDIVGDERTIFLITNYDSDNPGIYSTNNSVINSAPSMFGNIKVMPWAESVAKPDMINSNQPAGWSVHPNNAGKNAWADMIYQAVSAVSGGNGGSSGGGPGPDTGEYNGSSSGDNYGYTGTCSSINSERQNWINTWHETAARLSVQYGIPWEAVMSQSILESAMGTTPIARAKNNLFGIGARDECPMECAYTYNSLADGWEGYFKFIASNSRYRNHGAFQGEAITNPYIYLQAIKNAGYATDPAYVQKNSSIVCGIIKYALSQGWELSSDLAKSHPEMLTNAANNAAGANVTPPSSIETGTGTTNINNDGCIASSTSTKLVSGGMTLEQAQAFMAPYIARAQLRETGTVVFDNATVNQPSSGPPPDGTLNNCSAFSQWFVNRYTSASVGLYQGEKTVDMLASNHGFSIGTTPKPYSVFSWTTINHTGVVLGVDTENDLIIVGEASYNNGLNGYPRAKAYKLSTWTSNYQPKYAYTDGILTGL